MSKTNKKLAAASVLAAGLGAAYFTKKKIIRLLKRNSRQPQTATATQNAESLRQKQQGHLLYQRKLRSICTPGEAGRRR